MELSINTTEGDDIFTSALTGIVRDQAGINQLINESIIAKILFRQYIKSHTSILFIKRKQSTKLDIVDIIRDVCAVRAFGTDEEKSILEGDIETAYLEKEIERMYDRLAKTGRDTSVVSYKLSRLKRRKKNL